MATKCVPFELERLEAKSKCTDMTSTSDRSRTTEDGSFFITDCGKHYYKYNETSIRKRSKQQRVYMLRETEMFS